MFSDNYQGMQESIKAFARISKKAVGNWLRIFVPGMFFTIVCTVIAIYECTATPGHANAAAHGIIIGLLIGFATSNPSGFVLLAGSTVFTVLYFVLANKTAIQTALSVAWEEKAVGFVQPKMKNLISKLSSKQPGWMQSITSWAMLKVKLIAINNQDKESPLLKRKLINYCLKRVKMNDVDFRQENLDLPEMISAKIIAFISGTAKPSFLLFWILFGIQSLLLVHSLYVAFSN